MSIVVIGVDHRSAPLALLERVAIVGDALAKALHDLHQRPNVSEAVVLSTCNRTEVFAAAERFHGAYADIRDFFCSLAGLPPEDLHEHLVSYHDEEAVAHLFELTAGLHSAVLGESEILGQVKGAWEAAQDAGAARATMNLLFRRAVEAGKRARTETAIGRGTASVSHAAVEMAEQHLGSLHGAKVVVLGAGEMGAGMVVALAGAGVGEVVVANRTIARARQLAERVGGRVAPVGALADELAAADLLLTSTGADIPVVELELMASVMAERRGRALLVVDVGVPRDVQPDVAHLEDVTLLDLDSLRAWADTARHARAAEAAVVRALVREDVVRYLDESSAREVAPLVAALHERADGVRRRELERHRGRLAGLSDAERDAVEALTRGIVAKLLHEPSVRLKHDAGTPRGERNAAALRDLFDLP